MLPPFPPVDDAVFSKRDPVDPAEDVPEVSAMPPLTPAAPALDVEIATSPLDWDIPCPERNVILPPEADAPVPVLSPAYPIISPPVAVVLFPTTNEICPLCPPVADPVSTAILPDAPDEVVPVENLKDPLTPVVPAFTVFMLIFPLDVAVPVPDVRHTAPPESAVLVPPNKAI
jgi:hypothetical protein